MYAKERLRWSDDFAWEYATHAFSRALIAWLRGAKGDLCIAAEHFRIKEWDDVVIWHDDGVREHVQIKKQFKPIAATTLASTLKAIANWHSTAPHPEAAQKIHFTLAIPALNVAVGKSKKPLQLVGLAELIKSCSQPGVSVAGLRSSGGHSAWLDWFGKRKITNSDSETLALLVRDIKVTAVGDPDQLKSRTLEVLEHSFNDPAWARAFILQWLRDHSDPAGQISPRDIWRSSAALRSAIRPQTPRWISYRHDVVAFSWKADGNTDHCPATNCGAAVDTAWDSKNSIIEVDAMPAEPPTDTLARLGMHAHVTATVQMRNAESWRAAARLKVAGTFGEDAAGNPAEGFVEKPSEVQRPDAIEMAGSQASGSGLSDAMNRFTWNSVSSGVAAWLQSPQANCASDVRAEMTVVWRDWVAPGSGPLSETAKALSYMERLLSATMELNIAGFDARARVGARTIRQLREGLILHLAVAAASDPNSEVRTNPHKLRVLALSKFGRLVGSGVLIADVDTECRSILPYEQGPLVLSSVRMPGSMLREPEMHHDASTALSMVHAQIPNVATRRDIETHMRTGLSQLQVFVTKAVK